MNIPSCAFNGEKHDALKPALLYFTRAFGQNAAGEGDEDPPPPAMVAPAHDTGCAWRAARFLDVVDKRTRMAW